MFRKNYLIFVLMVAALMVSNISVFAQIAPPVTGKVVMVNSENKEVVVVDALVEAYRTDISAKLPGDKTNKKGEFGFAGFQFGATYALVVSGEGIEPLIVPGIKAGAANLKLTVIKGSGKALTEAEVRDQLSTAAAGGSVPTGPSEDDKKKAEELEKERLKVEERNKKLKQAMN